MSIEQIKVTINRQEFAVDAGSRLIDVCREKGFGIPAFCYYKDLEIQASCRMCLVRIDKMPKLQTSCTILCTDGMVVTTQSEEVEKAQRAMGEFLLAKRAGEIMGRARREDSVQPRHIVQRNQREQRRRVDVQRVRQLPHRRQHLGERTAGV